MAYTFPFSTTGDLTMKTQYFWRKNSNGQLEIVQKKTYADGASEWFKMGSELEFYDSHIQHESIICEIFPPGIEEKYERNDYRNCWNTFYQDDNF